MTIREEFEKRFPVPECVIFYKTGNEYLSKSSNRDEEYEADSYNEKWTGFQAGWEARGGVE